MFILRSFLTDRSWVKLTKTHMITKMKLLACLLLVVSFFASSTFAHGKKRTPDTDSTAVSTSDPSAPSLDNVSPSEPASPALLAQAVQSANDVIGKINLANGGPAFNCETAQSLYLEKPRPLNPEFDKLWNDYVSETLTHNVLQPGCAPARRSPPAGVPRPWGHRALSRVYGLPAAVF